MRRREKCRITKYVRYIRDEQFAREVPTPLSEYTPLGDCGWLARGIVPKLSLLEPKNSIEQLPKEGEGDSP